MGELKDFLKAAFGKRVLITGCGPIGALAMLVAKISGAAEPVVTDIAAQTLEIESCLDATLAVNPAKEPDALKPHAADKGKFHVLIEATGNEAAIRSALELVRPGGTVVQLGLGGDVTLPMNSIVAKELNLKGTFCFDPAFEIAVLLMARKVIDVRPMISTKNPFARSRGWSPSAGFFVSCEWSERRDQNIQSGIGARRPQLRNLNATGFVPRSKSSRVRRSNPRSRGLLGQSA